MQRLKERDGWEGQGERGGSDGEREGEREGGGEGEEN